MSKCGECCYGVMTGPTGLFCSANNCLCAEVFFCEYYEPIVKPTTNADRIRAMTDEELAIFLYTKTCEDGYPQFDTVDGWLDWLRQEATD